MPTDRRKTTAEDLKREVLAKIANPAQVPRLWYGMPGYAKSKDAPVLCFFRKDTFISFGITESVKPNQLNGITSKCYPSAWYITSLDEAVETLIQGVVKQATSGLTS